MGNLLPGCALAGTPTLHTSGSDLHPFPTDPQLEALGHVEKQDENKEKPENPDGAMMWGDTCTGASVASILLVVGGILWGRPCAWAVTSSPWMPISHWALRAVLGVVYLPAQAKDLATLVGALRVAHLQ